MAYKEIDKETRHAIEMLKGCKSETFIAKHFNVSVPTVRKIHGKDKNKKKVILTPKQIEALKKARDHIRALRKYGTERYNELASMQVWETELPDVNVVLLEGYHRWNLYDRKGVLRNGLKLTDKLKDCSNFREVMEVL